MLVRRCCQPYASSDNNMTALSISERYARENERDTAGNDLRIFPAVFLPFFQSVPFGIP